MAAMDVSAGFALRWFRAALLAVVALLAGVVAHVSAGGLMPGPVALGSVLLGCMAGSAWMLKSPASTSRVVLLLVAAQTAVHGALTGLAGHRGDPPTATAPASSAEPASQSVRSLSARGTGAVYDQLYGAQAPGAAGDDAHLSVPAPLLHLVADMTGPHAAMALAHLAAAAVVGLWLALGERALWTVLALADRRVRCLVHAATAALVTARAVLALRCTPAAREHPDAARYLPEHLATTPALDPAIGRSLARRGPPLVLAA